MPQTPDAWQEASVAESLQPVLDLLACPVCLHSLEAAAAAVTCAGCGRRYPVEDGIAILLADRARVGPTQP